MSTTRNPNAPTGEFHSKIERDEPMTTSGHQPGKLVGNDAAPEFSAHTIPAGTAPADRTFKPNNISETPNVQQHKEDVDADVPRTAASDTLGGATSADVHTGLGHPGQGQSSAELRHDGQSHRKNPGMGGAEGLTSVKESGIDSHLPENKNQRAADKDEAVIGRGNNGGLAAEERHPESAESVASGRR